MVERLRHAFWAFWQALKGHRLQLVDLPEASVTVTEADGSSSTVTINIDPPPPAGLSLVVDRPAEPLPATPAETCGHPEDPKRFRVVSNIITEYEGSSGAKARDAFFAAQQRGDVKEVAIYDHGACRGSWIK